MADPVAQLAEFGSLLSARELAAARVVAAAETALAFFEAQDFEQTESILRHALNDFHAHDRRLTEFCRTASPKSQKESSHGHRAA